MNRNYHKIAAFSLVFMLLLSPSLSFAKNNENGKNNSGRSERNEKVEKNERDERDDDDDDDDDDEIKSESKKNKAEKRQCLKAFGHLIAKGYIKNKGEVSFIADCFMPFGIKKKFGGNASSTDSIAPVITNIAVNPNSVKATITWKTNEKADSTVFWGTTPNLNLNSSSTLSFTKTERVRDHRVLIENLSASTTYYFVVRSRDASANTSTSSETSFRTASLPTDIVSPVISNLSYLPGTTTVMVSWNTDENASSRIYFSTTSPLSLTATTTTSVFDGVLKKIHLLTASGLNASTTYYFAVESLDQSGNKSASSPFTVITQ